MIFAFARWAIDSSEVGVMIWSPLLMKYQDGIVFHAAARDGVVNAALEAARWVAHKRAAVFGGRSLPNEWTKTSSLRYRSLAPGAAPASCGS